MSVPFTPPRRPASIFTQNAPNLDLLRAMAVLFVLICHTVVTLGTEPKGLPYIGHLAGFGTFGVLIFFVHTSLVLMLSLERMERPDGSVPVGEFYIRRIFRIYPLAMATVLLTVVIKFSSLSTLDLISNLGLFMNFTESKMAIFPLWSLPYEIDMYAVLPFLFLFAIRFRSAWSVFGLLLVATVLATLQMHTTPKLDLIQYVGCFLPGIIAYQLSFRPRYSWPWWLWPTMIFTIAVGYTLLFHFRHPTPAFPIRWSCCLALGLAAPQFRTMPDGRIRQWAHTVAKYSYGIYLLHILSLHFSFVYLANWGVAVPLRVVAFLVTIVVFPYAAYYLIEKPGIDVGKRLIKTWSRPRGLPEAA